MRRALLTLALPNLSLLGLALLAAGMLLWTACSDDEEAAQAEPEAVDTEPVPAEEASEAPAEEVKPEEPEGRLLEVSIKEARLRGITPSPEDLELMARTDGNRFEIHIEHLNTYCTPLPEIEARVVGETLRLRLQRPEEERRCTGPHSLKLHIRRPAEDVEEVVLVDVGGETLGTAEVTRGQGS